MDSDIQNQLSEISSQIKKNQQQILLLFKALCKFGDITTEFKEYSFEDTLFSSFSEDIRSAFDLKIPDIDLPYLVGKCDVCGKEEIHFQCSEENIKCPECGLPLFDIEIFSEDNSTQIHDLKKKIAPLYKKLGKNEPYLDEKRIRKDIEELQKQIEKLKKENQEIELSKEYYIEDKHLKLIRKEFKKMIE